MKSYSLKFWIIFWSASALFLAAWFLFWNIHNKGLVSVIDGAINILPIGGENKKEYQALAELANFMFSDDGREKTFLVLFQNNLEIRPGGGFLGAFGIVKTKNFSILSMETQDLSNFDAKIPNTIDPPYPMREIGYVDFWKMRDSNFSPDFATNAQKAEEFYYLGQGSEKFEGVIGITANMLTSMLKVTGPIQLEGYPGTYDSGNAIIALEYQVEKAFDQQGIDREQRKSVINDLAREIKKKVLSLSTWQKIELAKILIEDLNHKDVQLYFKNQKLQDAVIDANWAGSLDQKWDKDYLMMIDANLGSFKSDYYMKRSAEYIVDLSGERPVAHLKITYQHTANQKDWMTRDYLTYLRVYVPAGATFENGVNFDDVKIGNEFGKQYFGALVKIPVGTSKTVEITYALPDSMSKNYSLKIQKQAGLSGVPIVFRLKKNDGLEIGFSQNMDEDIVFN